MKNKNILILSAGRRVELVQSFKSEILSRKLNVKLYASDLNPRLSAACNFADQSFTSPPISDYLYGEFLFDLCIKYQIGLVVPTIDTDLLILAKLRQKFSDNDVLEEEDDGGVSERERARASEREREKFIDSQQVTEGR